MLDRLRYALFATILDLAVAIVYFRVGEAQLFDIASAHQGPFSPLIGQMQAVFPVVLMLGLLFPWAYVVYGAVQTERTVDRRRVRR
jgi:hypothetical protein